MKLAVTSTGNSPESGMCEKFGRCKFFVIYDTETENYEAISNFGETMESGAGPKAAEMLIMREVEILLTGNVGDKAENALIKGGIKIVTGYTNKLRVKDVVNKYLAENN
ncbi:MAG: NifB/NifX family molybdenum-iron cluster-binding protein [Ignavibacteria bacterium]|nr:NifB/NifX family molybdenum-iron cluster-binding protein [Ignavibacteria bacterium]